MIDLLIRGATVVTGSGATLADIAVDGGTIVEVSAAGLQMPARRLVDAQGLHVLPGLVDAHVHLREPGLVHKEGFHSGTRAAIAGGVTTVMVMPTDVPATLTAGDFHDKMQLAAGQACADFALQAGLGRSTAEIESLTIAGAVSFEIFLADIGESLLVNDAESLLQCLEAVARVGAIAGITPGDHDVVTRRTAAIRARSSGARADFPGTRPPVSEALGVARACVAARETGARIHIRQLSCRQGAEALAGLRSGVQVTSEVTPHNLLLDESALIAQGPVAKVAPPLRAAGDVAAMREALATGLVDIVATDHAPHLPQEKAKGETDIWLAPGGLPGVQTMLPAMLKLVDQGLLSLSQLVQCCATSPARIFRLVRKGQVAPGFDADLVLLDRTAGFEVRSAAQESKARFTPFEGLRCQGTIRSVFLRGRRVLHDGTLEGEPLGRFVRPD